MGHTLVLAAQGSLDVLLVGREIGLFHLVCYLREGDRVFETYWTTRRGVEAFDNSYTLMDLTAFGRQEAWEDSPPGWPQHCSIRIGLTRAHPIGGRHHDGQEGVQSSSGLGSKMDALTTSVAQNPDPGSPRLGLEDKTIAIQSERPSGAPIWFTASYH